MASWCCNVPKFTAQLPACHFTRLPSFWCSVSPSDNASRSASESELFQRQAQATWRQAHGHLSIRGHEQWLQLQLFSPPIWQNLQPWFSGQTPFFSSEVPLFYCCARTLTLLLATALAEAGHDTFNWSDFACNFPFFSCPLLRKTL